MAPRPSDVKAVAALLVEGADTPEDLAKLVFAKVDELRAQRAGFCLITEVSTEGHTHFNAFGPFATRNQALKAVERGLVPEVSLGARWRWGRMFSEGYLKARLARADEPPADKKVVDAKKMPVPSDPHMKAKDVEEIKALNRETLQWATVWSRKGRR